MGQAHAGHHGLWAALFVTMAVIPSFWLYFADGTLKWTGTFTIPYGFGELELPMQAVRDVIVVIWYGLALGSSASASTCTTSGTRRRCRPVRRSARPPVATSRRRERIDR